MTAGGTHPFAIVDVFADRPLTGNPLAVVPDADGLPVERMRALAREFNQSETTFLLTPSTAADHRLRSFTAAGSEVGGAGHNALGAWLWLAHTGAVPAGQYVQQLGDDLLDVTVEIDAAAGVRVEMAQSPPRFGRTVDRSSADGAALAAALGVDAGDLDTGLPAQVVSTGAGHLLVPLATRRAVDSVQVDVAALRSLLAACGGEGAYVFSTEPGAAGAHAYARFFNPTMGIVEDPATGTAAGPLAAFLVRHGRAAAGAVVIDQGHALGRPSRLRIRIDGDDVRLSGGGLLVAEGRIAV